MKRTISDKERQAWRDATKDVEPIDRSTLEPPTLAKMRFKPPEAYDPILDLHHKTVQDAYHSVDHHLSRSNQIGWKRVTVITGRSGPICQEFESWLNGRKDVKKVTPKNGGGAWEIWLRKTT